MKNRMAERGKRQGEYNQAMDKSYVIVGGGLAGATCAYMLTQAGRKVTLLERQSADSKSKLCGGLMTPRSMKLARQIFGSQKVDALFRQSFSEMLCITGKHEVMLENVSLKSVIRREFDDMALASFIEYGGELCDRCDVKHIDFKKKIIVAKRAGAEQLIPYDVLIAADGALSTVRKLQCERFPMAVLSLETEVEAVAGQPLTMLYDASLHGYCWYIPRGIKPGSSANIGCVSYGGAADLDERLHHFAARENVTYKTRRGAFIPTGGDICLERDGVFYLGDASGLICPPTGEGIYYALLTAERLFQALTCDLSYPRLLRDAKREVERQYKMRDTFFSKRFMDAALTAADHTPYGTQRAVRFALKHFAGF